MPGTGQSTLHTLLFNPHKTSKGQMLLLFLLLFGEEEK